MAVLSTEFPQFCRLPPELRLRIWFFCLPRRAVQRDNPLILGEIQQQQMCWSLRSALLNAAPPLIASVCRESRAVVRRWGKLVSQDYCYNLGPIWVQPRLDLYVLNSDGRWHWQGDDINILLEFLDEAFYRLDMMPLSLRSVYYFPFSLDPPPEPDGASDYPHLDFRIYERERGLRKMSDSYNEFARLSERPHARASQSATLAFICIHTTKEQAADSGLFGLLLDAPVQLVDFDDEERLRAFHDLFKNGLRSNDKRLKVCKQFDAILAPDFQCRVRSWREKVDWLMMTYAWMRAKYRIDHFIPIEGDPGLAWSPPLLDDQTIIYMNNKEEPNQVNVFNNRHPWVVQAKKELPRITPKIQFLLCTDACNVQESVDIERFMEIPPGGHSPWFRSTRVYADLPELP